MTQAEILDIIAGHIDHPDYRAKLDVDATFRDLGLCGVDGWSIAVEIEDQLGRELHWPSIEAWQSVRDVIDALVAAESRTIPEPPPPHRRRAVSKAMAPACMKCEQVTGKSTCFPGPCVFFHERSTPGTKANQVATLDRIRRGSHEPIRAPATCGDCVKLPECTYEFGAQADDPVCTGFREPLRTPSTTGGE